MQQPRDLLQQRPAVVATLRSRELTVNSKPAAIFDQRPREPASDGDQRPVRPATSDPRGLE
ncbi:UNVERIFIED_CONTAM: hypothetical protein Slati_0172600 [Sesamum latifolium]|uniref:Uncharacterized protein n=1 Tax=Sesamum latifolium TaxID=2727402 RepID=A0AAW2YAJ6_9LAMI